MRVNEINGNNIAFRSGYPTFGVNGHLNYKPDVIFEHIYYRNNYRPSGLLDKGEPEKSEGLDYLA